MRNPQKVGERGSLKWLQLLIEGRPDLIETEFRHRGALPWGATIEWVSPRESDDWAEYRDAAFLRKVNVPHLASELADFWPRRGPQWDALGVSNNRVYLVEAKAHLPELASTCAASPSSRRRIAESLSVAARAFGSIAVENWLTEYYQYANRLAHLHFLQRHGVDAWLVFLGFTGATGMSQEPVTAQDWAEGFAAVHRHLGLPESAGIPGVVHVHIDVAELSGFALGRNAETSFEPSGALWREGLVNLECVLSGEAGSLYTAERAGRYLAIADETEVADLIGEPECPVTIREFGSRVVRDAFVGERVARARRRGEGGA